MPVLARKGENKDGYSRFGKKGGIRRPRGGPEPASSSRFTVGEHRFPPNFSRF